MRIVLVDDKDKERESLKILLTHKGYNVVEFSSSNLVLTEINSSKLSLNRDDFIIIDQQMPYMDGLELGQQLKSKSPDIIIVILTAYSNMEKQRKAFRDYGFFDYWKKGIDDTSEELDHNLDRVRNLIDQRNASFLKARMLTEEEYEKKNREILGKSKKIIKILEIIDQVAPTDARVFINGENGTGKELIARAIHHRSKRALNHFVAINCAAIPANLIESELFGHEKGSFTGATAQRIGKFEQADGGTLFLDEIGDMPIEVQAKVLRALEEGVIERVGGAKLISIDVRVLAATNKNIDEEIQKGNFRNDLFHRLNVIPIVAPALREHPEDIPVLIASFMDEVCKRIGISAKTISNDIMLLLQRKPWPGNIRELRNIIERMVILSKGTEIDIKTLDGLMEETSGSSANGQGRQFIQNENSSSQGSNGLNTSYTEKDLKRVEYKDIYNRLDELEEGYQIASQNTNKAGVGLNEMSAYTILTDPSSGERKACSHVTLSDFFNYKKKFARFGGEEKIKAISYLMNAYADHWPGLRKLTQVERILLKK
jgi:two-component system, NtrC family, nitrogen regulation response regulator NtrX